MNRAAVPGVKRMELMGRAGCVFPSLPCCGTFQGVLAGTGSWKVIFCQSDGASTLSHRACPGSAERERGRHSPLLCSSSTWQ